MHMVKLNKEDRDLIAATLEVVIEFKMKRLVNEDGKRRMIAETQDAINKIQTKTFIECGRLGAKRDDNLFGWIKDQVEWCKLDRKDYGERVVEICREAGHNRYGKLNSTFNQLFEIE